MPIVKTSGIVALLTTSLLAAGIAHADERSNPFVRPPSEGEQKAVQDQRMRNIVWEMQPELKSLIMQEVRAEQNSLEVKMRRRIEDAVKNIPVVSAATTGTTIAGSTPGSAPAAAGSIPEDSKFVVCVNGKALYRDKDNSLFQVAGDGVPDSHNCAR